MRWKDEAIESGIDDVLVYLLSDVFLPFIFLVSCRITTKDIAVEKKE